MRVGTSTNMPLSHSFSRDHPHACGDKGNQPVIYGKKSGSSPCVWGQGTFRALTVYPNRIIPMRVGTSLSV